MKKIDDVVLVVGCDVDGTLTKMNEYFLKQESWFKKSVVNSAAYDLEDMYDVSSSKVIKWGIFNLVKYCKEVKVNNNTKKVVQRLICEGSVVHCITARKYVTFNNFIGSYMQSLVVKYNKNHDIRFSSYSFCSEDEVLRDKYLNCFQKGVELMFEDKSDVALYLAQKGITVGLINAPYNQNVSHENIYRLKKLTDYEALIKMLKEKKLKSYKEYKKEVKTNDFSLSHIEFDKLSDTSKNFYVDEYKKNILDMDFDEEGLLVGKKRYKKLYNLLMLVFARKIFTKAEGKENLVYKINPVYVSNHLDSFDQFSIVYGLKKEYICGFAADTIKNTFRGKLFNYLKGAVFINRKSDESKKIGFIELEKIKVRGNSVLIFPEGTRKNKYEKYDEVELLDFKLGAFNIAKNTKSVIVPVTLVKKNKKSKFTKVIYGKPVVITPVDDTLKIMNEVRESILNNLRSEQNENK